MKFVPSVALVVGLIVATTLIGQSGVQEIGATVAHAGWGTAFVVLARVVAIALAGIGWWLVLDGQTPVRIVICVGLRMIREAVNTMLPVLQVGGEIVGARLTMLYKVAPALAIASIITDVFLQAATQFIFAGIGLVLLNQLGGGGAVVETVAWGLGAALPVLVAFFLVQRGGANRYAQRGTNWVLQQFVANAQWQSLSISDGVYGRLASIQARPWRLGGSAAIHMCGWLFGSLEVYLALSFMGHPVGFAEAIVIESLAHALRGAAFVVPGALGVQEGGLIALCGLFGVPAQAALALSLIKRVADLAIGIPALLVWQRLENSHATAKIS